MPDQGFQQLQKQSQSLVLAPQLRQSLKILQAPAMELRSSILEELELNPTLEELPMDGVSLDDSGESSETDSTESEMDFEKEDYELLNQLDEDWRDGLGGEGAARTPSSEEEERRKHFFDSFVGEISLQQHLLGQADLSELDTLDRKALEFLIGSLNRDGFLEEDLENIALVENLPLNKVQQMRDLLLTFDPVGIGAKDRRECLLVQLELSGKEKTLAARILREEYPLLLRRRIPELSRKFGVDTETIHRALADIGSLDPAPGRRFAEDNNRVIVADVKIFQDEEGEWKIILNNDYIPRLRISSVYKSMIAQGKLPTKEREYLRERIRSGRFLMNSIEQRQQTVERIAWQLLDLQKEFFEEGVSRLRPLTMNQVAEIIGVHETTVSRAIANKYIDTPHGIFEIKYFFTAGYETKDGNSVSNRSIKDTIQQIVDGEDSTKPLSDQVIVEILKEKGYKIARRTVAKYRDELGILPTNLRRSY
ncbi:MAG: RNA polymerase factor sigma-54 [Verrucomicrobiota bacterium]